MFFFLSYTETFLKWPNKLGHFGQNVWKYRLINTVMVSFDTTARQMTEISQEKTDRNVSAKKKTGMVQTKLQAKS